MGGYGDKQGDEKNLSNSALGGAGIGNLLGSGLSNNKNKGMISHGAGGNSQSRIDT